MYLALTLSAQYLTEGCGVWGVVDAHVCQAHICLLLIPLPRHAAGERDELLSIDVLAYPQQCGPKLHALTSADTPSGNTLKPIRKNPGYQYKLSRMSFRAGQLQRKHVDGVGRPHSLTAYSGNKYAG
jgi:hypothetical protein